MKQLLIAAFVLLSSGMAFGQSKCFENSGLKDDEAALGEAKNCRSPVTTYSSFHQRASRENVL